MQKLTVSIKSNKLEVKAQLENDDVLGVNFEAFFKELAPFFTEDKYGLKGINKTTDAILIDDTDEYFDINKVFKGVESNAKTLSRIAGETFVNWAELYFTPEYLNCFVSRKEMYAHYKSVVGKNAKLDNNFKKSLEVWCRFKKYDFNPLEKGYSIINGKHRKIMNLNGAVCEVFYIQTKEGFFNQS